VTTRQIRTADGRTINYCVYGPPDGVPVVFHNGSPSTRLKRPEFVRATEQSGICLLVHDRPGYGGSTRQAQRSVASVVADVTELVDAQGWDTFAVTGGSGGGPHALACAALLGDRVTRCAVTSSIAPPLVDGPEPTGEEDDPRRNRTSWLAARDVISLRREIEETARQIMAAVEAGGPEFPGAQTGPAKADPASMARLQATFVDSHDGWVDDNVAFAHDWGFELGSISVPVSIWCGDQDDRDGEYASLLLLAMPFAECYEFRGGHIQTDQAYRDMLRWLTSRRR
jgi:pimeloyl-ACP methyl ester carboxylesterase